MHARECALQYFCTWQERINSKQGFLYFEYYIYFDGVQTYLHLAGIYR